MKQGHKQIVSLVLGPLACWIIQALPAPGGMTEAGMLNMGACAWFIIWWMSEVFPMPVTAVLTVPVFALLGLLAPAKAFAYLGSPSVMLIFGATILVGLLKESRFITRYAYWSLSRPFVAGRPWRILFMFTMGVGLLSAIAPNISLALLFTSITLALGRGCGAAPSNRMMRGLCVLSGVGPAVGGIGTPLGGAPNLVVIALIGSVLGRQVGFWEWSALGMPLALVSLVMVSLAAGFYFLRRNETAPLSMELLERKLTELGPVTRYEHIAVAVMAAALVLWCFGPALARAAGWPAGAAMLSGPFVAVLMGAATFLIPLGRDAATGGLKFSMSWPQAMRHISWDILIITLGILAFGQVLLDGGVDRWAARLIRDLLGDIHGTWVWLFLVVFTGLCSQVVTNIALVSLVIPLTASLAGLYGFNPLAACVAVGMTSNVAVMFPFSSVTAASAMLGGAEYTRPRDFAGFGLLVSLVISLAVFGLGYALGDRIFPV